jgi:hypothetical protein
MSKFIDISRCAAVRFTAIKFLATEARAKESTALEIALFDKNGVFMTSCTAPYHVKEIVAAAGVGEKVITDATVRVPFNGLWNVRGLQVVEGDKNASTYRLYGDYEVIDKSTVEVLERKNLAEFNPF